MTAGRLDGLRDSVVLAVLVVDGALLGTFGLLFNPLYYGVVPVPMGALLTVFILPWLVLHAAEVDPRMAVAPLVAWAVTVVAMGVLGPGGDVLLPQTWQSALLCIGGFGAGYWAVRRSGSRPSAWDGGWHGGQ